MKLDSEIGAGPSREPAEIAEIRAAARALIKKLAARDRAPARRGYRTSFETLSRAPAIKPGLFPIADLPPEKRREPLPEKPRSLAPEPAPQPAPQRPAVERPVAVRSRWPGLMVAAVAGAGLATVVRLPVQSWFGART